MLPNFEPQAVLPRLSALLRPHDRLLLGANLAPGQDYDAGVRRILPQYDNALARDWLMTFLLDLGVERTDGEVRFAIEDRPDAPGLKRVRAAFHFNRRRTIQLHLRAHFLHLRRELLDRSLLLRECRLQFCDRLCLHFAGHESRGRPENPFEKARKRIAALGADRRDFDQHIVGQAIAIRVAG